MVCITNSQQQSSKVVSVALSDSAVSCLMDWTVFHIVASWKPIADYVEQQFEQFYQDETGLNRHNIKDTRVHCCLYFIPPYGHGYVPAFVHDHHDIVY